MTARTLAAHLLLLLALTSVVQLATDMAAYPGVHHQQARVRTQHPNAPRVSLRSGSAAITAVGSGLCVRPAARLTSLGLVSIRSTGSPVRWIVCGRSPPAEAATCIHGSARHECVTSVGYDGSRARHQTATRRPRSGRHSPSTDVKRTMPSRAARPRYSSATISPLVAGSLASASSTPRI